MRESVAGARRLADAARRLRREGGVTARQSRGQGAMDLLPGGPFPDLDLPDHTGRPRTLSEIAGGDPLALFTSRGWWCPKEQRYMRELCRLQDEFEVAYSRIVVAQRRPARGPVRLPGRARRPLRLPLRRRAPLAAAARACSRAPTPFTTPTAGGLHALPRSDDPPCLRRLLVLGPAHDGGAAARHARDHPRDPQGLGGPGGVRAPFAFLVFDGQRLSDDARARAGGCGSTRAACRARR